MEQQQLMAVSPMVWLLARRIRIGGGQVGFNPKGCKQAKDG